MSRPQNDDGASAFLVLAPYRSHVEIMKFPGSRVLKANCGHYAWLSPQGEGHVDTCYTVCVDCIEDEDEALDPEIEKTLVPGTLDYIRRTAGAEVAERAERYAKLNNMTEAPGVAFRRPAD